MENKKTIQQNFEDCMELSAVTLDTCKIEIEAAAGLITRSIFNDNKLLCCGNGGTNGLAEIFNDNMLNHFNVERPGLPCILLNSVSVLTSISNDYQFADIYGKQIRALGQEGDILVVITTSGETHNILHAIDSAHDRNMTVVALTACDGGQISDQLKEQDIEIRVSSWDSARIIEQQLIIIHCICDLIDRYLLGQ